jgi:hypothetical protein
VHQRDEGPSAFAWLAALISLVLPWAGIALGLFGIWTIAQNEPAGWWFLIAGGAMFIAGPFIDLIWAHRAVLKTDQPDLNRRNQQLVGRVLVVEEAIDGGRGKVRVGDTLWPAEGPDTPAGMLVRVTAAQGTVLVVERAS